MLVRDVMTAEPETTTTGTPVGDVVDQLMSLNARHLPVLDGGRLVGIVTERDLRTFMMPAVDHTRPKAERSPIMSRPIGEVLTGEPIVVRPESQLRGLVDLMVSQKIEVVAVVDDSQRLVGIVSYVDALRAALPHL